MELFNVYASDSPANREIWHGESTNLIQLNRVKYQWATKLYDQMRTDYWVAHKVDLSTDVTGINLLTAEELNAFKGTLGYLVFLDSMQVTNLPYLMANVTAPEIRLCFAEQLAQEGEHARSYQYVVETLFPEEERNSIYDYWRKDKFLQSRCEHIALLFQEFIDQPNEQNYLFALVGDYLLEGLFFYNGFNFFYAIASRGLMTFTKNIIQLINRDEKNHVYFFQQLLKEYFSKNEILDDHYLVTKIYEIVNEMTMEEITWSQHILGDKVLGISSHSIAQYTEFRANNLLKNIGIAPLYKDATHNPYKHLEKMADIGSEANAKANFFDSTITTYVQAETLSDWDF